MGIETAILGSAALSAGTSIAGGIMGQSAASAAADSANKITEGQKKENRALTGAAQDVINNYLKTAQSWNQAGTAAMYAGKNAAMENLAPVNDYWGQAYDQGRSDLNNALSEWDSKYGQVRADNAPYMAYGQTGMTGYQGLLSNPSSITNNPGYQFRLNQGSQTLDRSAAAKGQLFSGGAQAAQQQYGQDYASNEYDKALTRYNTMIPYGQNAVAQVDNAGMTTAAGKASVYNSLANLATAKAQGLTNNANTRANMNWQSGIADSNNALAMGNTWYNAGNQLAQQYTNLMNANTGISSQQAQTASQAVMQGNNALTAGIGGAANAISQGVGQYTTLNALNNLSGSSYGSGFSPQYMAAAANGFGF